MKKLIMSLAVAAFVPGFLSAQALPEDARGRYAPDNTGKNASVGTDARTSSKQDLSTHNRLLSDIRSAVTADKSLSMYGHNVKITTEDGKTVTLRGPVKSQEEKMKIEQIARAHAQGVVNELEVKP